jgi:hypothetical protein
MGPIRQRAGELHTAVIEFAAGLRSDSINTAYLPQHTFIILSQVQSHAANLLDDLDTDEIPSKAELATIENALDGIIDTYDELKERIAEALDNFRHTNISVVKDVRGTGAYRGRLLQISIGGTNVWRRVVVPETCRLALVHRIIQTVFGWPDAFPFRFTLNTLPFTDKGEADKLERLERFEKAEPEGLDLALSIRDFIKRGLTEALCEYNVLWTIKVLILSPQESQQPLSCIAGSGAAPPARVRGPLRFKKDLFVIAAGNMADKQAAIQDLGEDFDPDFFDLQQCKQQLEALWKKVVDEAADRKDKRDGKN